MARWLSVQYVVCLAVVASIPSSFGASGDPVVSASMASPPLAQPPIVITGGPPGPTPFISNATISAVDPTQVRSVDYVVKPKSTAIARPVHMKYSITALRNRVRVNDADKTIVLPLAGLYADYLNEVTVGVVFLDGSSQSGTVSIATDRYVDPNGIYDHRTVITPRNPALKLAYDYVLIKSGYLSPVVMDTDGEIRWEAPAQVASKSQIFDRGQFVIGNSGEPDMDVEQLDGAESEVDLNMPTATNFNHNIDPGKVGYLAEIDITDAGTHYQQSTVVEFLLDGSMAKTWDFVKILTSYMQDNGDDPARFVRPWANWFHSNAATYDPRDDSVIVSSRENFVIKVDYATGTPKWILGDPTKYWHTFPSLRKLAIKLERGDHYPIGQHATSITSDGLLLMFDNGNPSQEQPKGEPAGKRRNYSAARAYSIDPVSMTGREVWNYTHDRGIYSSICSSVYEDRKGRGTYLVDYAVAAAGRESRIVGLDAAHTLAFEYMFANPSACGTAWNSIPIPFDDLAIAH